MEESMVANIGYACVCLWEGEEIFHKNTEILLSKPA